MATCPDGAGSINNPNEPEQNGTNDPALTPYVPPNLCKGEWEISGQRDECAEGEFTNQQTYVAEVLNINGAPVNIYKLLGVHEQGVGSVKANGEMLGSDGPVGFELDNLLNNTGSWQSPSSGSTIIANGEYFGISFGYKNAGTAEYVPLQPNYQTVAAVVIKQANTAFNFARQVRVDISSEGLTVKPSQFVGVGDGLLSGVTPRENAKPGQIIATAFTPTEFMVYFYPTNGPQQFIGVAEVDVPFTSPTVDFVITSGTIPFESTIPADEFTIQMDYVWKRAGIFNLVQSAQPVSLNLQSGLLVHAIRVIPTLYTASGPWEILEFDVLDSAPTNINNIQDLFFNENRDRDYDKIPLTLKCQYTPNDSISDLAKFGINILDQYLFTTSFATMVSLLGRPIVTGDILEIPNELQYDQNLKPIRKFLEVTDTGWASEGFSPSWRPTVYRFSAQQALPSQETRDIFGTIDTQKYMMVDSLFGDGISDQIDTTPLTQTEEIIKMANDAVPEIGSDDELSVDSKPIPVPQHKFNAKAEQPQPMNPAFKASHTIEDGLPPAGEEYGEGYKLPDVAGATDGEYFRLYYPDSTDIPPRLYRFSAVKNRWIYLETDRRGQYSSHKPSIRKILESSTKQGLNKKLT